jgi:hypothetical protein
MSLMCAIMCQVLNFIILILVVLNVVKFSVVMLIVVVPLLRPLRSIFLFYERETKLIFLDWKKSKVSQRIKINVEVLTILAS